MLRLSREQVRCFDRLAIEELGIPGVVLMENAGRNAAGVVLDVLRRECGCEPAAARVVVLCGGGNNGGDGYVIARHLHNAGVRVTVCAAVDPDGLRGDAAVNHAICSKMGLEIHPVLNGTQLVDASRAWSGAHVVVDALLGTGFRGLRGGVSGGGGGGVRPHMAAVIRRCNGLTGVRVVAVDVPSGLDCDSGEPSDPTIRAGVTVSFVAEKRGFAVPEAAAWVGRVVVADIGAPLSLVDRVRPAVGGD